MRDIPVADRSRSPRWILLHVQQLAVRPLNDRAAGLHVQQLAVRPLNDRAVGLGRRARGAMWRDVARWGAMGRDRARV